MVRSTPATSSHSAAESGADPTKTRSERCLLAAVPPAELDHRHTVGTEDMNVTRARPRASPSRASSSGLKGRHDEQVAAREPRKEAVADEPVAEVCREQAERAARMRRSERSPSVSSARAAIGACGRPLSGGRWCPR